MTRPRGAREAPALPPLLCPPPCPAHVGVARGPSPAQFCATEEPCLRPHRSGSWWGPDGEVGRGCTSTCRGRPPPAAVLAWYRLPWGHAGGSTADSLIPPPKKSLFPAAQGGPNLKASEAAGYGSSPPQGPQAAPRLLSPGSKLGCGVGVAVVREFSIRDEGCAVLGAMNRGCTVSGPAKERPSWARVAMGRGTWWVEAGAGAASVLGRSFPSRLSH